MPALTREQIDKLAEIIQQHADWFTWRTLGTQAVDPRDIERLRASGLLPMDANVQSIKYAWVLGKLESILKEQQWKNLNWDTLVAEAEGRRLTPIDRLQVEAAELTAKTKFRGLADDLRNGLYERLSQATQQVINESFVRETIKEKIKTGVEFDRSYRQVARDLVETLKETSRDWTRVAVTELHAARQTGYANAILNKEDIYEDAEGPDSQVAIVPTAGACKDCIRMYVDPKTGHPKIFLLKELLDNAGTNYIKPWRQHAKPVVPPLHPSCFCELRYVPPGWGWDQKGNFTLVDPSAVRLE